MDGPNSGQQIQDGGQPVSGKIENREYLGNSLTNLHEIWHGDAYWPSE